MNYVIIPKKKKIKNNNLVVVKKNEKNFVQQYLYAVYGKKRAVER